MVRKPVKGARPSGGNVVTFTVTLSNQGPDAATGAQMNDLLPSGLTLMSATVNQGTYNSVTGLWSVGQVDTTAPATLTLQAKITSPSAATNTATISHSDQFDPDTTNNSAVATETPQQADLA